MGIGGGVLLIVLGAILTFALKRNVAWVDLHVVGIVLMLAGLTVLVLTVWFLRTRRQRATGFSLVEETRTAHGYPQFEPEPPDIHLRPPLEP